MPLYDFAYVVTIEADSWDNAMREAKNLAEGLQDEEMCVLDYGDETDNERQRVVYLHPAGEDNGMTATDTGLAPRQG